MNVLARIKMMETDVHVGAVECLPSEGRGKPAQFIPIRFDPTNKPGKDAKLLLAFEALLLSEMLGHEVSLGKLIHDNDYAVLNVNTSTLTVEVRKDIDKIVALLSSFSPPDLVLIRHCTECEFEAQCRQKAMEKDDLSQLSGMTAKERRKKRHNKGIFTVTQLSYTFRPRRRSKRLRHKQERYQHPLRALALREKKIHIVGSPELKIEGTPIYIDVEGLPDRDFYYLIGMRLGSGTSAIQHSFWANNIEDEKKIWSDFLGMLAKVQNPVLIHYGSYETTFFKRMCDRYGFPPEQSSAVRAIKTSVNLLSVIFAKIYFPTFSNGLKDIGHFLGVTWDSPVRSGLQSLAVRLDWEQSHDPTPKVAQNLLYSEDNSIGLTAF
jgi:predicted RecB family nuclease